MKEVNKGSEINFKANVYFPNGDILYEDSVSILFMHHNDKKDLPFVHNQYIRSPELKEIFDTEVKLSSNLSNLFSEFGDKNPIHTSYIGARILGQKAKIAHGMCIVGKVVQLLEQYLADKNPHISQAVVEINASFRKPVTLPSNIKVLFLNTEANPNQYYYEVSLDSNLCIEGNIITF